MAKKHQHAVWVVTTKNEDGRQTVEISPKMSPRMEREHRAKMGYDRDGVIKHLNINSGEPKMATETDEQRFARTNLSSVRMGDDEAKAVQKTQHRVSLDTILMRIKHEDYEHPSRHPHMTLCILTTETGFIVVGKSTPADPENFDVELGKKFAKEDAIRQLWPLEAYLLRERMSL